MPIMEGVVNSPSNISFSDGDDARALFGKTAEQMIAQQHESLYSLAYRGKVFHGYYSDPSGQSYSIAIPITTTTTPSFILWNPKSSNINLVLIEYAVGWVSGTNVEGNVQLGILTNLHSQVSTGSPLTAFTDGPVINGLIAQGNSCRARFGVAATITAATQFYPLGMNLMVLDAAKSTSVDLKYRFYGALILTPGTAAFSCASSATVAKYHQRISWYEYPT
jgi:hypothetical protein